MKTAPTAPCRSNEIMPPVAARLDSRDRFFEMFDVMIMAGPRSLLGGLRTRRGVIGDKSRFRRLNVGDEGAIDK